MPTSSLSRRSAFAALLWLAAAATLPLPAPAQESIKHGGTLGKPITSADVALLAMSPALCPILPEHK